MSGEASDIIFISEQAQINSVLENPNIVKLHFRSSSKYGCSHRNWGDTKGEDHYQDVCVMLNKATAAKYADGKLSELAPSTKNKL